MTSFAPSARAAAGALLLLFCLAPASAFAQSASLAPLPPSTSAQPAAPQGILVCTSEPGDREFCAADTSAGVALVRSIGKAPCVRGESWDYDSKGIYVSDGCSGAFLAGQ